MTEEIEIEGKALVTKDDFLTLLKSFHVNEDEAIVQNNYYFETPVFSLKQQFSALRIRKKNGAYTLTLKEPHDSGILETHQSISEHEWTIAIEHNKFPEGTIVNKLRLRKIPIEQLQFVGQLLTRRIEFPYKNGLLCLDISEYFDKVDYEIEFEGTSTEHVQSTLATLFSTLNITPIYADNKMRRFFKRKNELDKEVSF